jgi:hypothetical protein
MTANTTTLSAGTDAAGNAYGAGTYIFNYPFGTFGAGGIYTLFDKLIGFNWVGSIGALYNGYYIGDFCNDTRTSFGTYFGSCTGTSNDRVWTFLSSSAPGISIDLSQDVNPNKYYGSTFTYTLPSPIYLQNLQLYTRGPYLTFIPQIPKSFRVYGMNIGDIGWTQIANYSNLNAWTSYTSASVSTNIIWDGATNAENLTFKINALTSYSIYGFVVNALIGTTNENFTLAEIKLFGTDYYVPASGQSGTITSGGKAADNTGGGGGGSQLNIIEPQSFNVESIYPPYRYFTYNDTNGVYTVQNGSMEQSDSTNFSYTYSYNDPANTQGNNEQTSSTLKYTHGMGLYKFSIGGTHGGGSRSSGIFIYGLTGDYGSSTNGNRPGVNFDDNQSAAQMGAGWYQSGGWTNVTTDRKSTRLNSSH